jgi:hypothetical protein
VSRRPRGTCPVCRNTLSLCWSGEIKVLRKHSVDAEPCPGSGRPAVGEASELHVTRPAPQREPARSEASEPRVASVA